MSYQDALKELEDAVAKLDIAVVKLEDAKSTLTGNPGTRNAFLNAQRAGRAARRMMQLAPSMEFDDALKEVKDATSRLENLIAALEDAESASASDAAIQKPVQDAKSAALDAADIVGDVHRALLDIQRESNEIAARLSGHSTRVVDDFI